MDRQAFCFAEQGQTVPGATKVKGPVQWSNGEPSPTMGFQLTSFQWQAPHPNSLRHTTPLYSAGTDTWCWKDQRPKGLGHSQYAQGAPYLGDADGACPANQLTSYNLRILLPCYLFILWQCKWHLSGRLGGLWSGRLTPPCILRKVQRWGWQTQLCIFVWENNAWPAYHTAGALLLGPCRSASPDRLL